jgi:O-antigen/teichoic acid export membrane protein
LWLGIGSLCTFSLSFVSAAILSRYFDKAEYGTYKQVLYVYGTLSTLFLVGLPNVFSYFIPRLSTGEQKTLVTSLNRLFLLLGGLFSVFLYLLSDVIADLLKNPELSVAIKIFSPFPLFTLPTMGVEGIYTALRKTKYLAYYHVMSKCLMLLCIVLPVVCFHTGYREAIIGWGIASFLIFLVSMYMKNRPYVKVECAEVANLYGRIFDYSLPLVGAFLSGFFINSADQFFISRYYGTSTFAEASNGCLSIPIVAMVASSVKSVLTPMFSKADAEGRMDAAINTYMNATMRTVNIAFPILLFAVCFAKPVMVFLYGEQYAASAPFLRVFMLRDFFDCLPYFAVLMALGKTKFYMYAHVLGAAYIWLADFALAGLGACAEAFVGVSTSFQILLRVASFIYIFKVAGIVLFRRDMVMYILKVLAHGVACLCVVSFLWEGYSGVDSTWLTLLICGVGYYLLLVGTGRIFKLDYLESIKSLCKGLNG